MRKIVSFQTIILLVLFLSLVAIISCDEFDQQKRDCVVMLGDSVFADSNFYQYLQEQSNQRYRIYYESAATMTGVRNIEDQYERAIRDGDIRTIIMNGGAADNLVGASSLESDDYMIREVNRVWLKLLTSAKSDGVQNLVVLGYYKTDLVRDNKRMDQWRDEVKDMLIDKADEIGVNLIYIDPRDDAWFAVREPYEYLNIGGIVPDDRASKQLASLVWQAMVANNIEQGDACP